MIKSFSIVLFFLLLAASEAGAQHDQSMSAGKLVVITGNQGPVINKNIYGHFSEHLGSCIYGGIWVGRDSKIPNTDGIRNDVLSALKALKVPNLRWPGGCFADTYHWKDGIGPQSKRASIVNVYWGGVTEDNSFGTHEFMKLTELVGCDAYINGNVGSGTVREMAEWIEYLTSDADSPMTRMRKENGREDPWKLQQFAIGNENWGCGGNMTSEYYGSQMRQYSTYLNDYAGNKLYRVACGANGADIQWTETLMKDPGTRAMFQGISLHYYSVVNGWENKGSATRFDEKEWFETFRLNLAIEDIIKAHENVMNRYDPEKTKGLIVDEWGNWFKVEPGTNPGFLFQQNTMRDAISAAIQLNIFNRHADRIKGANIAQMVNVLQSVILTNGDKMVLTPTYHVFRMFSVHQNARLLDIDLKCEDYTLGETKIPSISASASVDNNGRIHISLANLNPGKQVSVTCPIVGESYKKVTAEILSAPEMNSFNTFDKPDVVKPAVFSGFTIKEGILTVNMPSKSVVVLELSN